MDVQADGKGDGDGDKVFLWMDGKWKCQIGSYLSPQSGEWKQAPSWEGISITVYDGTITGNGDIKGNVLAQDKVSLWKSGFEYKLDAKVAGETLMLFGEFSNEKSTINVNLLFEKEQVSHSFDGEWKCTAGKSFSDDGEKKFVTTWTAVTVSITKGLLTGSGVSIKHTGEAIPFTLQGSVYDGSVTFLKSHQGHPPISWRDVRIRFLGNFNSDCIILESVGIKDMWTGVHFGIGLCFNRSIPFPPGGPESDA